MPGCWQIAVLSQCLFKYQPSMVLHCVAGPGVKFVVDVSNQSNHCCCCCCCCCCTKVTFSDVNEPFTKFGTRLYNTLLSFDVIKSVLHVIFCAHMFCFDVTSVIQQGIIIIIACMMISYIKETGMPVSDLPVLQYHARKHPNITL